MNELLQAVKDGTVIILMSLAVFVAIMGIVRLSLALKLSVWSTAGLYFVLGWIALVILSYMSNH